MPEILDWPGSDAQESLRRACQHLQAGRLVVFPSEVGHECAACALDVCAVAGLKDLAGFAEILPIAVGHVLEVFDWVPFLRGVGTRLARRFWPGPLTLVSGAGLPWGLTRRLPTAVTTSILSEGLLGLRQSSHSALREVLQRTALPLLLAPCPVDDPISWSARLGDKVGLVIRRSSSSVQAPTVVRWHGREWRVLRQGVIPEAEVAAAARCRVIFVCTGNTCRSPLAEALCKKMLADRLRCRVEDLPGVGFIVESVGMAAQADSAATAEAVDIARRLGADLSRHRSRPMSAEMLMEADFLVTMTYSHLRMLHALHLGIEPRLLSSRNEDIDDPIGGSAEFYEHCARQIETELVELLPELLEA